MAPSSRQYSTEQERLVALEVRLDNITSDITEIFRNTAQQSKVQTEHTVRLANIEDKLDGVKDEIVRSIELVFSSFKPKVGAIAEEPEKKPFAFLSKSNLKVGKTAAYTFFTVCSIVWGYIQYLASEK